MTTSLINEKFPTHHIFHEPVDSKTVRAELQGSTVFRYTSYTSDSSATSTYNCGANKHPDLDYFVEKGPTSNLDRGTAVIWERRRTKESMQFIDMMYAAGKSNDWNTVSSILEKLPEAKADFFAEWAFHVANLDMQLNLAPRIERILRARGEYPLIPPQEAAASETSSVSDPESPKSNTDAQSLTSSEPTTDSGTVSPLAIPSSPDLSSEDSE